MTAGLGVPSTLSWNGSSRTAPEMPAGVVMAEMIKAVSAVGLDVPADATGSAVLIWRFRAECHQPRESGVQEKRVAIIVAVALAVVSVALIFESVAALAQGSRPSSSAITLLAGHILGCPLAAGSRQAPPGQGMASRALQGDGTLSAIGAAASLLALAALALYDTPGWWADRIATLVVAADATTEAWHTALRRHAPRGISP